MKHILIINPRSTHFVGPNILIKKLTLIYDWSLYHISRHDPQTHKKLKNHMDALLIRRYGQKIMWGPKITKVTFVTYLTMQIIFIVLFIYIYILYAHLIMLFLSFQP